MTRGCLANDFEFARRSSLRRVFLCPAAVTLTLALAGFAAALRSPLHAAEYRVPRKELGFPVYTNAPLGRQLSGAHVPASTPALSPDEAQRKFTLPEGFEIRLFASEPEVVNPVAMTWDERGRLWVVELYEYPLGAKPGEPPRDRIKILEDTDADGHADKVTVWADGLNLATGLLLGNGGAYVGQAPHLLFLKDTDGDGRADVREVVKTGFGMEDRHELLNGFTWGPDGQMYMTHGVFTRSKVKDPNGDATDPVLLTAGVARMNPATKRFEVYAEGTSNPWGVDFDRLGNAFVSACVIEHLFHLTPGGLYDRQAGTPPNPYAYQSLPAINDHKHHMAAYAGVQVYQGDQFPADNLGTILQGNIHDNAVHQDVLKPNGSSFVASKWRDLVRANDGWFMPVSTQVGPDGAVWIMDWYDRYPCYQNANADPEGVDREHGRIWRVVYTGGVKGKAVPSRPSPTMDLAKLASPALVELLASPNIWQRRTAQRLLDERRDPRSQAPLLELFAHGGGTPAAGAAPPAAPLDARLAALWTLHGSGFLTEEVLTQAAADAEAGIRLWAARLIGERQAASEAELAILRKLAADADPSVRLAVAVACRQFTSGQLTVNRPPAKPGVDVGPVIAGLVRSSADGRDPVVPFMIWQAAQPLAAVAPDAALGWLAENGPGLMPLSGQLSAKAMRLLGDLGGAPSVDRAVAFIEQVLPNSPSLAASALEGLIEGQAGKALLPSKPSGEFIAKLLGSDQPSLKELGQKLGTLWGDEVALQAVLARARDAAAPPAERVRAIQSIRQSKADATRATLLGLLTRDVPEEVQLEAITALGEVGGDSVPETFLQHWKDLSPAARRAAAGAMASRRRWALPLLAQVKGGTLSASDFGAPVIRALLQNADERVREEAKSAIGKFRESTADKAKLIAAKRAQVLAGEPDREAGREVARKTCFVCHKLHGEGADVGPDLTGVGRSSLDALLANVIDPNQVIGAGYEQVEIETRDDRVVAGRLVENTANRVRLLLQGPKEEVVAKSDIRSQRTLDTSVMPEGLEQMPDADFRNLIWFLLAPPQEGPLTPQKRDALIGGGHAGAGGPAGGSAVVPPARDGESVALWNPEWHVHAPDFEGTPAKLPTYLDRGNVLQTHPFNAQEGAALERRLAIPAGVTGAAARLRFAVAAHDQGDWELRVVIDGAVVKREVIDHAAPRWKTIEVDLAKFAGREVTVRLENRANDWAWEFGYWADLHFGLEASRRAAL